MFAVLGLIVQPTMVQPRPMLAGVPVPVLAVRSLALLAREEADGLVEVLPAIGDSQDMRGRPGLSDAGVARIFELVFRDTRKVLSEYRFGDMSRSITSFAAESMGDAPEDARSPSSQPVFAELIRDRLPMLQLYAMMRYDSSMIALNDFVESINLSPRGAADLRRTRAVYERRLMYRRSMLWPTLRTLLRTPSMNRRLVDAAQTQVALQAGVRGGSLSPAKALIGSPRRLVKLWAGAIRAIMYVLRWVLNEFGLSWVLSPRQRQRVRVELIERAIVKGLELQKRVDRIEKDAKDAASWTGNLLTPRSDWLGGAPLDQVGVQKAALMLARWRQRMGLDRSDGPMAGATT